MKNQKGQTILILILVMTVALAIGISVTQRSLSDISTSTKVEESSRAFSAAEAGIDKAVQNNTSIASPLPLGNNSTIDRVDVNDVPASLQAYEYPPLKKEEMAHVWLAHPDTLNPFYTGTTLGIYWGNATVTGAEIPAIAVTVVYLDTSNAYKSKKYFLDPLANTRNNKFDPSVTCSSSSPPSIPTSLHPLPDMQSFYCMKNICVDNSAACLPGLRTSPNGLVLVRARLLYNNTTQSFAVNPTTGSLPRQGRKFVSTGIAGETTRKVQVVRTDKVVLPYFDYGIFSMGEIDK